MGQVLLNSIAAAAGYWLMAVSFGATYRINRFFDMTPAASYAVGAYTAFALAERARLPGWLAILAGMVVAVALSTSVYRFIFAVKVVQRSRTGEKFIISLGIVVAVQSGIAILCGDDTKLLGWNAGVSLGFGGVGLTRIQAVSIGLAIITGVTLIFIERFTKSGLTYRAVACDQELSQIFGIRVSSVRIVTTAVSGSIAGLAGILGGADVGLTPGMGFRAILMGMVAAIVGGIGGFEGLMAGAVTIAVLQNFVAYWLSSAWQDAIVFMLLISVLLFRPQGMIGTHFRRTVG